MTDHSGTDQSGTDQSRTDQTRIDPCRRVRFHGRVSDGLAREIAEGEAGGILLGRRTADEILIDDFEPALCEHRFGASYVLSDEDLRGLAESVEWCRGLPDGLGAVGFYRSQVPPGACWNERDEELMRQFFPELGSLLLLLKPEGGQTMAECFVLDEGTLRPAAAPCRFPAEEIEFFPPAPPKAGRQETRPSERPVSLPAPTRPRSLEREEAPDRSWLWVAALVLLTLAGALVGYRSVDTPATVSQPGVSQPTGERTEPVRHAAPSARVDSPPAATTAPAPAAVTTPPADAAMVRGIQTTIEKWQRAVIAGDPKRMAALYAPTVIRRAALRTGARNARPAIVRVSALTIVPISRNRAVATFRRHWQTRGRKVLAGEDQQRMTLVRVEDEWKIATEEETRVYWTQRTR